MPFDTTTQTRPEALTGVRPVTQEDPAGFACGRRFRSDGTPRADYGKVFASSSANPALTRYDFDRGGFSFARLCPAPDGEWLEVQGRLFKIEVGQ